MVRSVLRVAVPVMAGAIFSLTSGCFGNGSSLSSDGGGLPVLEGGGSSLTSVPGSESFGSVAMGAQSASATVKIVNSGSGSTGTLSAGITGGDFVVDSDGCSQKALDAGASCSIALHFAPKSVGAQSGTLAIVDEGAAALSVGLTGTGTSPSSGQVTLSVSPGTQGFGIVAVGAKSAATPFTVTNGGTAAAGSMTLALTGQNAPDYVLSADGCTGKPLAAGASCTASVTFAPTAPGTTTATLGASAAGTSATATASLSGTAAGPAALSLTPTSDNFGSIVVGTATAQQTFTVANTGGQPSGVVTVTMGGANPADFAVVSSNCTAAVPAGSACTFALAFTPSAVAAESATVTVAAPPLAPLTAALTGTGLAPAAIALAPAAQDFGSFGQGATGPDLPFVVTNGGNVATGALTMTLGGSNGDQFGLGVDGCSGQSLAANGGSCTVNVHFAPTVKPTFGNLQATLVATGTPGGTTSSTLTGATLPPATLALSTPSQGFGTVAQSQSSGDVPITVTNTGALTSGTLTAALSGTNVAQFGLGADSCTGQTLAGGASCTVNVHFAPTILALGMQQAVLSVSATPGGSPSATLTGTAVPPAAVSAAPASLSFGSVAQGAANTLSLTITNNGGASTGPLAESLGGTGAAQFAITSDKCAGQSLPTGGVCSISVAFQPALGTLGAEQATLTVTGNPGGSLPVSLVGSATTPLVVTPGTQALGVAAFGSPGTPVVFTVTNVSAATVGPLTVTLQGADGPQFQLSAGGTCAAAKLAGGKTCTVSVLLSPTSGTVGTMQTVLDVNAGMNEDGLATLTGTAVKSATLAFTSSPQNFNDVVQGQSSGDVPLTVTNSGGVATGTLTAALSGANMTQFGLGTDTCTGKTVAAGASCTVNVHFAPGATVLGAQAATLTVSGTPGGAPSLALSGTAVTQAAIGLAPATATFVNTVQGSVSADTTFTATNTGGVATGKLTATLTGAAAGQFAISSDTCSGQSLAATTGTCAVKVHFTPTLGTLGAQQASLAITGSPGGTAPATLIGTATSPLTITPASESFPNAAYQSPSAPVGFTVTNTSASAVGPLTVALGGTAANQYALAAGGTCAGATLASGGSATCLVNVVFSPGQGITGSEPATLTVEHLAATTSVQASLSGIALTPAALTLTGNGSFGTTVQGTTSGSLAFTVANTGGVPTGTLGVTLGGANPTQFKLGTSNCPTTLGVNGSCTVNVEFAPGATTAGAQTATLTASATPGGAPAVSLSGTAVKQAAISVAGSGAFANTVQGSTSAPTTFTVTNTGGVATGKLSVSALTAPFVTVSDGCTAQTLAAAGGSSCTVVVQFAPTVSTSTKSTQSATLSISGTPGGSTPVTLSGTATPALTITPASATFATAGVGLPSGASFTVKNVSTSSVGPLNVGIQGTNATEFQITIQKPVCGGATLAPGGTCIMDVSFAPTGAIGPMSAILDVNAGANADVQAPLSGTAAATYTVSVALDKVNTTLWAGTVTLSDGTRDMTFTDTNVGGAAQTFVKTYFANSTYDVSISAVSIPQIQDGVCMIFNPPYTATNPPPGAGNFCATLSDYQAATATVGTANVTLDLYCRSQEVCF